MPNHLIDSTSPYLLQHAHNPVDWYPWGEEALQRARDEGKPIFLSIGYSACHWCHVMAHESFEDPDIAAYLNQHFISIKVDREERPDIDAIYMNAVVAMTGQGGWPMSLFLTPNGKPFFGGTYFPPNPRYNMPAFEQVVESVVESWQIEREAIESTGDRLLAHIRTSIRLPQGSGTTGTTSLEIAEIELLRTYNWQTGGWGGAPKFPQAMAVDFLISRSVGRHSQGLRAACHALDAMSAGGIYDMVGGGFHRYSTDAAWLVPHFEKMLYDNALLAGAYLHAYLVTGSVNYRRVCERTLDFIISDMTNPQGGFYSSLDADTGGEEGKTYTWTIEEINALLGDGIDLFRQAFDLPESGNFYGQIILKRRQSNEALSAVSGQSIEAIQSQLEASLDILNQARRIRPQPGIDDKVLPAWNGLAVRTLAEAGRYLGRQDYLAAALKNAQFILSNLLEEDELHRSWRAGKSAHPGALDDYAGLALSLLALYQASGDSRWYLSAERLAAAIQPRFGSSDSGFYDSQFDSSLPLRPKEFQDNAVPSGNALSALVFLQLAELGADPLYRQLGESLLSITEKAAGEYPLSFAFWLQALDFSAGPVTQVAILTGPDDETRELLAAASEHYNPRMVLAWDNFPPGSTSPPLLLDRPLVDKKTTAYVCRGFYCRLPVTTPAEFRQQLEIPAEPD